MAEGRVRRASSAACLLLLLLPASSFAQTRTIHDTGLWLALFSQGDFNRDESSRHKLVWWFDGQARFLDDVDYFSQGVVRPGIGRSITDNADVWIGYAWIRTQPVFGGNFDENRCWQQLTWSISREPLTFALRTRLEQRFLETGGDTGWRFRQFFRIQHDMPRFPRLRLVCWDEMFFHLNDTDWGANSGFDQNRIFAGFGWKRDPESRLHVEVGYLNQSINIPNRVDITNHILSVNLFRGR